MRLDTAKRAFLTLATVGFAAYLLVGLGACAVLTLVAYRVSVEGPGPGVLAEGSPSLGFAVVFLALVGTGAILGLWSLHAQIVATRGLVDSVRRLKLRTPPALQAAAERTQLRTRRLHVVEASEAFSFTYGNGDLLAIVSRPAFDPASFTEPIGREEWLRLVREPGHPLLNRTFQSQYSPGSIFWGAPSSRRSRSRGSWRPSPTTVSSSVPGSCTRYSRRGARCLRSRRRRGAGSRWLQASSPCHALWSAVNQGETGAAAAIPDVAFAGKTGTAQLVADSDSTRGEDHAWFAGYAPADDPQVVVVVLVERGGMGGKVAAPVARRIFLEIFRGSAA